MNFRRKFSGKIIKCEKCGRKLIIKPKKMSSEKKILRGIIWMFFPLLLIVATYMGTINYKLAIFLVISYHFLCFIGIIGYMNYDEAKK